MGQKSQKQNVSRSQLDVSVSFSGARVAFVMALVAFFVSVAQSQEIKKIKGAEPRKHFNGRLDYDIDELIQASEDPDYQARVAERQTAEQVRQAASLEHKRLREEQEGRDDVARQEYIRERNSRDLVGEWKAQRQGYREFLKEKRKVEQVQEQARQQFVVARDEEYLRRLPLRQQNIQRAIASQKK